MAALRGEPEPLVLRRAGTRLSKRDKIILALLVLGTLALMAWMLWPLKPWEKLAQRPEALMRFVGESLIEALVAVALAWYLARAMRYERLTLDRAGIHYRSPLPGFLAALQPGWSHAWAQIRSAEIQVAAIAHPNAAGIILDVVTAKRRIAGRWIVDGDSSPVESAFAFRIGYTAQEIADEVARSPLVEYLRRMGVKIEQRTYGSPGFRLESSRVAVAVAAAVIGLILYAVADLMLKTEVYAVDPPVQLFILAGGVAFLVAAGMLAAARVPRAETIGVALLFGAASGFALYPGALRLNQLTDGEGPRAYAYRMKQHVLWEPRDDKLPALAFTDFLEYWHQFKPGAEREFLLRRGGLGFWQIELAPVREEMKAFYRANP